ncbi:hypothetical protein CC86DRAFT_434605 [Ophiobolus disseminans]|uniref:Uncharacterized protein n=1 Tax=Ophiobolus disseminans TaxID=1469910 RepID=A0A6A7ADP7_9PLEO|nr:hypothetical protein CC86DRAFT_434605 [Ophiobolus disseminans]
MFIPQPAKFTGKYSYTQHCLAKFVKEANPEYNDRHPRVWACVYGDNQAALPKKPSCRLPTSVAYERKLFLAAFENPYFKFPGEGQIVWLTTNILQSINERFRDYPFNFDKNGKLRKNVGFPKWEYVIWMKFWHGTQWTLEDDDIQIEVRNIQMEIAQGRHQALKDTVAAAKPKMKNTELRITKKPSLGQVIVSWPRRSPFLDLGGNAGSTMESEQNSDEESNIDISMASSGLIVCPSLTSAPLHGEYSQDAQKAQQERERADKALEENAALTRPLATAKEQTGSVRQQLEACESNISVLERTHKDELEQERQKNTDFLRQQVESRQSEIAALNEAHRKVVKAVLHDKSCAEQDSKGNLERAATAEQRLRDLELQLRA